jgi:hypothetical protein
MPYAGKSSGSGEYESHPVGRFSGIIYGFRDFGMKENNFGNIERRCYFAVESLEEFMEDGRPFAGFVFFNMKWGNMESSGKMRPQMQQIREILLDRQITDVEEWESFDENDYIGLRVQYKITEYTKQNKSTGTKCEILNLHDDQEQGEMYNEPTVTKDEDVEALPF